MSETRQERHDGPVSETFGLDRMNYLVWPRSLLQEMPLDWQERFATLVREFGETWNIPAGSAYLVVPHFQEERRLEDYRHPDLAYIESLRKPSADGGPDGK